MRSFALLTLLWLFALLPANTSAHHVLLDRSEPAEGALLAEPPREIVAAFDLPIVMPGSSLSLLNSTDQPIPIGESVADGSQALRAAVRRLPPGTYRAIWKTVSANDGEYNEGNFRFTVLPRIDPIAVLSDRVGVLALGVLILGAALLTSQAIRGVEEKRP